MSKAGKAQQLKAEDDAPPPTAMGGAHRPPPTSNPPPAAPMDMGQLIAALNDKFQAMDDRFKSIDDRFLIMMDTIRQGSAPQPQPKLSPSAFSSPEPQKRTEADVVPPTISLSDYLGKSPDGNRFTGMSPQISLQAPPPFGKRLTHLRDAYMYWSFLKDYKGYKLQNPQVAPAMRLVQYIAQEVLYGQLDLQQEIEDAAGTLLSDDMVCDKIAAHFSTVISTPRQFLQAMESIRLLGGNFDVQTTDVMTATLPVLTYLRDVEHFYALLAYMCPAAVPREDDYDRAQRTTVKFIVNRVLQDHWPWWRTDIWPAASKLRERNWSKVHAHIDTAIRTLVARFSTIQPLMETCRAFDGKASSKWSSERDDTLARESRRLLLRTNDSPQRANWTPHAPRTANDSPQRPSAGHGQTNRPSGDVRNTDQRPSYHRPQPAPHRVHLLEEDEGPADARDYSASPDEGEEAPLDAVTRDMDENLDELAALATTSANPHHVCTREFIFGNCTLGSDCRYSHDKVHFKALAAVLHRQYT